MATIKYNKKWRTNSLNKPFWKEVFEGRTITKVHFDKEGISSLTLDNGEEIFLMREPGTLYIKCEP
jgi:hypothetical protein